MRTVLRTVVVGLALAGWFWSQNLLATRLTNPEVAGGFFIGDRVHDLLTPLTDMIRADKRLSDGLLIVSSAAIDFFGVSFAIYSIFGPSVRPLVGILMCFVMRQAMQAVCILSAPPGVIWYDPGFPTLLVTYHSLNDYFFSGHTAIATLCAMELMRLGNNGERYASGSWLLSALAAAFFTLEVFTVLVLRAHWTMDVFTGAVAGRYSSIIALWFAPKIDAAIAAAIASFSPPAVHTKAE